MKKVVFLLAVVSIVILLFGIAYAETWVCDNCGTENTTNFCGNCGTKKPSDEWVCPDCQYKNTTNFCTNCGKQKPSDKGEMEESTITDNKSTDNDANSEEFVIRDNICFGDTKENVKSKESLEELYDWDSIVWFHGTVDDDECYAKYYFDEDTGALNEVVCSFGYDTQAWGITLLSYNELIAQYNYLKEKLDTEYGATSSDYLKYTISTRAIESYLSAAEEQILLPEYFGRLVNAEEWVVNCENYYVIIDLVAYYGYFSENLTLYYLDLGYRYISSEEYDNIVLEQLSHQNDPGGETETNAFDLGAELSKKWFTSDDGKFSIRAIEVSQESDGSYTVSLILRNEETKTDGYPEANIRSNYGPFTVSEYAVSEFSRQIVGTYKVTVLLNGKSQKLRLNIDMNIDW